MNIGYFPGKDIKNNVSCFLDDRARAKPRKTAFYFLPPGASCRDCRHVSMSYSELNDTAARAAAGFLGCGIKAGDRVLVFLPISTELYVSIAGLQRMAAIPVFLDSWARKDHMAAIIQNSGPAAMITKSRVFQMFGGVADGSGINIRISADDSPDKRVLRLTDLIADKAQEIVAVNQNDTALITYTTGSSGTPKGANRTHRFLAAQHYALKRLFPYGDTDVDLPVFPVFALNNIASGVTTVIPSFDAGNLTAPDFETLLCQIKACGVNCMTLSPSSFCGLAGFCRVHGITLDSLTRVLTGGAPVSETDIAGFCAIAPRSKNWILYGSTEIEPVACIESREMLAIKPSEKLSDLTQIGVNVGKIDPDLNYKLIKVNLGEIAPGANLVALEVENGGIGEIIVSGENVCEGYYNDPGAFSRTKIKDEHGVIWHRTGDLGRLGQGGFLWIVGRNHNIVARGGKYYFPVRPEIILKDLPQVINAAYLEAEFGGENLITSVVTLENADPKTRENCRKAIEELFAAKKIPLDRVEFIEDIPMDVRHHSKVDYSKLRQKLHDLSV